MVNHYFVHKIFFFTFLVLPVYKTVGWGSCPKVFQNPESIISLKSPGFLYSFSKFSAGDYLGTWLNIYRNIDFKNAKGNCTQIYYYISGEGKVVALASELVNQANSSAKAEVFIDPVIEGQLYVKFSHFAPIGDYKVVHTDYKGSALVFSCNSFTLAHWKYAWILVRNLTVEVPLFYYQLIEEFGISLDKMINIAHDNCDLII